MSGATRSGCTASVEAVKAEIGLHVPGYTAATLTQSAFLRLARASLIYTVLVMLWGAYVRASGSGAGCGDQWPLCKGVLTPSFATFEQLSTLIEFFHRVSSGVALVLVAWLYRAARAVFAPGHVVRGAALASLAIMIIEALIGVVIVRASLFGDNASIARASMVALHFVNTLLLLGALTLTVWWAAQPDPQALRVFGRGALTTLLVVGVLGWLLLGATGAVGALSRSLYPSDSLASALAREWSADAPLLLRLRLLHPLMSGLMGIYLVFLAGYFQRNAHTALTRQISIAMTALFFAQCVLGLLNVLTVVPTPALQLSHLLLMDALWIAFVILCTQAGERTVQRAETRDKRQKTRDYAVQRSN